MTRGEPQRSYPRSDRVRAAIKEILAAEVERLRDPGMGFVTITDVTMGRDMRNARVFYTVLGEDVLKSSSRDALKRATPRLRSQLAAQVQLRYTPTLEFVEDPIPERAARLDSIIADIHHTEETL